MRELKEEVGLKRDPLKFVCTDYSADTAVTKDLINFLFYGPVVTEEEITKIKIQESEISEYKFVSFEDLGDYIQDRTLAKAKNCCEAIKNNHALFLLGGEKVL